MKKVYKKDNFSGDNRGFKEHSEMHKATCSECHKECEIPFKPSDDRPVYCNDCFRNRPKPNTGGRFDRGGRFERPNFRSDRRMYQATCASCGARCEVPFEPRGGKPVYCNDCFGKNKTGGSGSGGGQRQDNKQLEEQIRILNGKLDKILGILNPAPIVPVISEKKPVVEIKTPDVGEAIKKAIEKKDEKPAKKKTATKKPAKKAKK